MSLRGRLEGGPTWAPASRPSTVSVPVREEPRADRRRGCQGRILQRAPGRGAPSRIPAGADWAGDADIIDAALGDVVPAVRVDDMREAVAVAPRRRARRGTRCCCRRPAPVSTCTPTSASVAKTSPPQVQRLEHAPRPAPSGGRAVMIVRLDLSLVTAWLVLVVVGIVMVSSATASLSEGSGYYLAKHGVYVLGSLIVVACIACVPLRVWEVMHLPCLVLAIVLCALVLVPGVSQEIQRQPALGGAGSHPPPACGSGEVPSGRVPGGLRSAGGRRLVDALVPAAQARRLGRDRLGADPMPTPISVASCCFPC